MPKFYTSVILLIYQSEEIGEKQFSFFGSKRAQIRLLMHVPLCWGQSDGLGRLPLGQAEILENIFVHVFFKVLQVKIHK